MKNKNDITWRDETLPGGAEYTVKRVHGGTLCIWSAPLEDSSLYWTKISLHKISTQQGQMLVSEAAESHFPLYLTNFHKHEKFVKTLYDRFLSFLFFNLNIPKFLNYFSSIMTSFLFPSIMALGPLFSFLEVTWIIISKNKRHIKCFARIQIWTSILLPSHLLISQIY